MNSNKQTRSYNYIDKPTSGQPAGPALSPHTNIRLSPQTTVAALLQ